LRGNISIKPYLKVFFIGISFAIAIKLKLFKMATKTTKAPAKKTKNTRNENYGIPHSKLQKLFEDSLKDIYWAEKALTKALPKMAKKATSPELIEAIENHAEETEQQQQKLEQIFELLGKKAQAKKCDAMEGLLKEAEGIMSETEQGAMRDAGIIAASQKVEHYEIATYGTLRTFANILGLEEAAGILEEILNEEKNADETLTGIAESINLEAADEEEE
jgi:ferritin-like metal-binding protein YciE